MRDSKQTVETSVPEFIKLMLEKIAKDRNKTLSKMCAEILIKGIVTGEYDVLTKTEKEYARLQEVNIEVDMLKYIRSNNAEKIHFLKNVKIQMFRFAENRKDIDKKDVIKNLQISLQISQAKGWTNETKKIKDFLKNIKHNGAYELNDTHKLINEAKKVDNKGGKNEKDI